MFQKGDSVVYGNLGVCKINDLVTRQFEGLDEAHPYYVLKPLYQEGVLYVPADNPKIALRAVLTADEANQLIDSIPPLCTGKRSTAGAHRSLPPTMKNRSKRMIARTCWSWPCPSMKRSRA